MAAIDKIYLNNYDEYKQFKEWLEQQPEVADKYGKTCKLSDFLWKYDETFDGGPVMQAPDYIELLILHNCPLEFIKEEIEFKYKKGYTLPVYKEFTAGRHFKIVKHPWYGESNKPIKGKWMVQVDDCGDNDLMWYHIHKKNDMYGTWDFVQDLVTGWDWCSDTAYVPSMRTLRRLLIKKWRFPVGTTLRVLGRYVDEEYTIRIIK